MASGPVIIGFDGSPAAEHAVSEGAGLLAPRKAIVVVVWEPQSAFDLTALPMRAAELPITPLDICEVKQIEEELYQDAQRIAQWGVMLATEAGLEAEGLAVADVSTTAETLVRVAEEQDAAAILLGARKRSRVTELLLGSTSQGVLHKATCPVVIVRYDGSDADR